MKYNDLIDAFGLSGYIKKDHSNLYRLLIVRVFFFVLYFLVGYSIGHLSRYLLQDLIGNYYLLAAFVFGGFLTRITTKYVAILEFMALAKA